jgi:hypothetical protein
MKYLLSFILIFNFCYSGYTQLQIKNFNQVGVGNTLTCTSPDKHLIIFNNLSDRIAKIDANLQLKWTFRTNTGKRHTIFTANQSKSGLVIGGKQQVVINGNQILENNPILLKFNNCLEPEWQRIIVYQCQYLDTTFNLLKSIPGIHSMSIDDIDNIYFTSVNDYSDYDSIYPSVKAFLHKFNSDGIFQFRNSVIPINKDNNHESPFAEVHEIIGNKIIISGDVYVPPPLPKPQNTVYKRAFYSIFDTSGQLMFHKIYNDDFYYYSKITDLHYNSSDNSYIGMLQGIRYDTINDKQHYEHYIIKWDSIFNEIKRVSIISTDSVEYLVYKFYINPLGEAIVDMYKRFPYENPDWNYLRSFGYFVKYDKDLNFKDSVQIDYMVHKGLYSDSNYFIMHTGAHPQNASSFVVSGYRTMGQTRQNFVFALDSTMHFDTVVYPTLPNDPDCNDMLTGNIVRNVTFNDTLTFIIIRNWKYNWFVGLQQLIEPNNLSLSPNPATTQVHITSPVKLESYTISNTSGTQLQSGVLENDNNIDISQLPQGLYFLQVQLENGQMVTKKLVRN